MKKLVIIVSIVVIALMGSCKKTRICRCVSPTSADTVLFTVGSSTSCSNITRMGMEEHHSNGSFSNTLHDVDCDDAPEY